MCYIPGGSDGKETVCSVGDLVRSLSQEDSLEKEMATHSSILAWRIPWTEEPGGLQSMGLQRVRHNLATKQQQKQSQNNCYDECISWKSFLEYVKVRK